MLSDLMNLKISLLVEGISIDESASEVLTKKYSANMSTQDYATTRGIPIKLNDKIFVNAPYLEPFVLNSPYKLTYNANEFYICSTTENNNMYQVHVFPVPNYYNKKNEYGNYYRNVVNTHTDRARINPILGCSMACKFCDSPYTTKYKKNNIAEMVDAIKVAVDDNEKPARHILISGGTPKIQDKSYIETVYQTLTKESQVPVDVMLTPSKDMDLPFKLLDWGINDIFINIEGTNETVNKYLMPQKYLIGLDHYLAFIRQAVKAFGIGRVMSLIIVGLEPMENTLLGVNLLAQNGCIPVLSPFRPAIFTPLEHGVQPDKEFLKNALMESEIIANKYGIRLGPKCNACNHNTLTPEMI